MRGRLGISVNSRVEAEDARWLLSMAGLSDLDTMRGLEGGWDNSNYHLRLLDGSEVVLKAWFANTLDEVDRVIQRHLHLDSHGIPTTVPIQMLDGHYVAVKDGFAWTLLPFVRGVSLALTKILSGAWERPLLGCILYLMRSASLESIGWVSYSSKR